MEIALSLIRKEPRERNSGLELSLYNKTKQSRGVQLGGVNGADESSYGVQLGVGNVTDESSYGVQLGGFNGAGESRGVQLGGFNYANESSYGVQLGGFNGAGESRGVQLGGFNYANESSYGVQLGGFNYAKKLRGAQFAFVINICGEDSTGVQIAPLNWRSGVPWYAKLVPIVAIRTRGKRNSLEEKVNKYLREKSK